MPMSDGSGRPGDSPGPASCLHHLHDRDRSVSVSNCVPIITPTATPTSVSVCLLHSTFLGQDMHGIDPDELP
jgi:hypothetical protein